MSRYSIQETTLAAHTKHAHERQELGMSIHPSCADSNKDRSAEAWTVDSSCPSGDMIVSCTHWVDSVADMGVQGRNR